VQRGILSALKRRAQRLLKGVRGVQYLLLLNIIPEAHHDPLEQQPLLSGNWWETLLLLAVSHSSLLHSFQHTSSRSQLLPYYMNSACFVHCSKSSQISCFVCCQRLWSVSRHVAESLNCWIEYTYTAIMAMKEAR